jgi:putative ABC transport system substrate-binding protein
MMDRRRRELILGVLAVGIAGATPPSAQTVAPSLPRVVIIFSGGDQAVFRPFKDRFLHGMHELGHAEGRTFRLEIRADSEPARSATAIRETIASRPDVLVVSGLTNARHAREATKTVPVVVATSSDLVDAGVVASFARPGGNVTGLTDLVDEAAVSVSRS